MYLDGDILPRLQGHVSFGGLLENFRAKGQMSGFMQDIPVCLILRKDAALINAVCFARLEMTKRSFYGR